MGYLFRRYASGRDYEILYCLSTKPAWPKLFPDHQPDKIYTDFLHWLRQNDFYPHREEKVAIKQIAADVGKTAFRVTQWLKPISEAVLNPDKEQRAPFQDEGIKACLYLGHLKQTTITIS